MTGRLPNRRALRAAAARERWALLSLSFPALLLVAVILLIPTGVLFGLSFLDDQGALSAANYGRLLQPSYITVFRTTFVLSALVTALSVLFGYPLAYFLSQLPPRAASLGLLTVLLPFWTSLLVRTYAWLVLLQRKGLVNDLLLRFDLVDQPLRLVHNFTGAAIGMTHIMVPFLVLPLYAAMRAIHPSYLRAAATLGASPTRAFWTVFVPLSLPGLLAGVALVFVLCLGFYVTPALLGGGKVIMVAQQIDNNLRLYSSWGAASALGVVLVASTLAIVCLAARLFRVGFGGLSLR